MESPSSASAATISFFGYRFASDPVYWLSGLEAKVIKGLPTANRRLAYSIFLVNVLLFLFVLYSAITFFDLILAGSTWLAVLLSIIVTCFYSLLASTSNSRYLMYGIGESVFGATRRSSLVQRFYKLYMLVFLYAAALCLSVVAAREQIANAYKKDNYEKEHERFVTDLQKINAQIQNSREADRKELIELYKRSNTSAYGNGYAQSGFGTTDSLFFAQKQNELKLNLFYLRRNESVDTLPPNDMGLSLLNSANYATYINKGLMLKKSDSLFVFNGIKFRLGDDIEILENYNDSIYRVVQEMLINRELLSFMSKGYSLSLDKNPRTSQLRSSLLSTEIFNVATRNWLQRLENVEKENMTFSAVFRYFFKLYSQGNRSVAGKTGILFFLISMIFFYLAYLLTKLRSSPYPKQVAYYRQSQVINIETYEKKLEEKAVVLNDITTIAKKANIDDYRVTLSMIKDDGSMESYKGFANYYLERKEYDQSLKWLEDGLNKFYRVPEYKKASLQFLNAMADVHYIMGNREKSDEKRDQYHAEMNAITVAENLSKKLSLNQFEVIEHKFYSNCTWKLQPGINVLLGKNGFGKSHLISILLAILQNDRRQAKKIIEGSERNSRYDKGDFSIRMQNDGPQRLTEEEEARVDKKMQEFEANLREERRKNELAEEEDHKKIWETLTEEQRKNLLDDLEKDKAAFENLLKLALEKQRAKMARSISDEKMVIRYNTEGIHTPFGKIPVLAIPDTRFIDKSGSQISNNSNVVDLARDGAKHFIYQIPFSPVIENFYYDACTEIYERQHQTYGQEKQDPPSINLIKDIYKRLTGVAITRLEVVKHTLAVYEMYVSTEELIDYLPIQKVSQGTFSVIAILGVIQSYLKLVYGSKVKPEELKNQNAIVIIDELDAHLHPSWQQKIINILRETFPNIQFIITAHSPFIVAGCSEMEVALLQKKPGDTMKYCITQFNQHFIGYSPDELCKLVFDIEKYDENFYTYINQTPRKGEIEQQIDELKNKTTLKAGEKEQLEQLHYELYRILKAEGRLKEQSSAITNF